MLKKPLKSMIFRTNPIFLMDFIIMDTKTCQISHSSKICRSMGKELQNLAVTLLSCCSFDNIEYKFLKTSYLLYTLNMF